MSSFAKASSRALIAGAAAVSTGLIGALATAATASAHVHAEADHADPGSTATVTFRVPGESETGALTTELSVELPDVPSARTEVMPGWTARLDRDVAAGTVSSVTWTAAPGTGISSDQFALFRITVRLPESESVSFPATQTYSDGEVVRWDQPPLPDGGEPELPVPVLELTGSTAPQPASADTTARWLAGGALALAAVVGAGALLARRRS
ncbi:YcnI family copper-binding membrane protein [Mycolicibacterium sp. XJ879]